MRRVAIAGVGITPRTRTYLSQADRKSWKEYVADAAYDAIANVKRGLHPKDIQYVIVNYHGEATVEAGGIGPVVSDILGLHPVGVTALCANCTGARASAHEAFGLAPGHEAAILDQISYRKYGVQRAVEAIATYAIQMYWYANRNPKSALYG